MAITINFTDAALRKLPLPEGGREEYKDGGSARSVNGLYLRVSVTGVKSFSVLKRIPGEKPIRTTIGKFESPWNVEDARKRALSLLNDYATSSNPNEMKRKVKQELTLQELFDQYVLDRNTSGKRSMAAARCRFERYVGYMPEYPKLKHGAVRTKGEGGVDWSRRRLSSITNEDITVLHKALSKHGKVNANRIIQLIRAAYNFGIRKKLVVFNPAEKFTANKEVPIIKYFKGDETLRFITSLRMEPQIWQDLILIFMYVGYRRSAIQSMAWTDLQNIESSGIIVWYVRGEKAKNDEPIALPIVNEAAEILRRRFNERSKKSKWVFEGGGVAGHVTSPEKAMERVLKRAEIQEFRIHDLRHNLATLMINNGESIHTIGKALGHKDPRSTARYSHLLVDTAAAALNKLDWPKITGQ